MKKHDNKSVLKSISIVILFLVVFLIIIAIINKVDEYNRRSYKLDTKFKTNDIVQINNRLPVSDTIGKSYPGTGVEKGIIEYKEFTISNPNPKEVKYEIYLTQMTTSLKNLRSSYIKLYLTDEKDNPVDGFNKKKIPSFYDLLSLNDKPSGRLLYKGSLKSSGSETFILRSWVSDTYMLSGDEEGFSFDIDVRIK